MSEVSTVLDVIRGLGLVITSGIFHETFSSLETWFSVGGGEILMRVKRVFWKSQGWGFISLCDIYIAAVSHQGLEGGVVVEQQCGDDHGPLGAEE